MARIVQKFGGTSVGDPDRMREVADYIARVQRKGNEIVVVISAMGKETDELLRLAADVSENRPGREMDMLITAGERKAMALLSMALHDAGVEAESFTGSQAGFVTDTHHTNAKILEIRPERIEEALQRGQVPVVGGAQGVSTDRNVTFLGRGGSDTTAVALAHAIGADMCELYTDVAGVYTSDPRVVDDARRMKRISYDEMLEMTASGCPKPAMRAVEFARNFGVALHVRSAFTWETGTYVTEEDDDMEQAIISAVTHETGGAKVTFQGVLDRPGIAGRLFRALAENDINVDVIVQNTAEDGHTDISFTVPREQVERACETCQPLVDELGAKGVATDPGLASVSVIGAGMRTHPGVAATVFETLYANDINIEMISTSAIRISCVVRQEQVEHAVQVLHEVFDLASTP